MRTTDFVGYGSVRPVPTFWIGAEGGWLTRPNISSPAGTFRPDVPETPVLFPEVPAVLLPFQPHFAHWEGYVMSDTRDSRSYPTDGALYRAAVTGFNDQSTGTFTFRQYEAEAAQFIQLNGKEWILALRGWTLASDVPTGHEIPFYLMPALGGNNTIRSYPDFRFHDRNLALVNVESRWALLSHVDGALFADAGNVAPRYGDLNLDKTGWGGGLRVHTESATWARLDVAYGAEGWHVIFRTTDPLRLSRVTRRVAAVPFVP
jgi:hypothetical protein